jgi:hypothetical protein
MIAEARSPASAGAAIPLHWTMRELHPGLLIALLLAFLLSTNLLLWGFLGFAGMWSYVAGTGLAIAAVACSKHLTLGSAQGPSLRTLALCLVVALAIFLLGGEGRFFYSNADWQVRDAVLRDLTVNSWPFVYSDPDGDLILRAPIGMFLIPALFGKIAGPAAADIALLAQNSLLLAIVLALGSTLFEPRKRAILLTMLLAFSGMDILGEGFQSLVQGRPMADHFEGWAGIQFSSHITQAFWVPQHALAGWMGALSFLLWRARAIRLGLFFAFVPLLALLSPLGAMGVLPFAIYAGVRSLASGEIRIGDILLPLSATAVAVPALLYLLSGGGTVGVQFGHVPPGLYLLFELLEAVPFLLAAAALTRSDPAERPTLIIIAGCLLLMPFVQIGESTDFVMRASITALALLAAQTGLFLATKDDVRRGARRLVMLVLLIGAATPAAEVARVIRYRPSPRVHCSLVTAGRQIVDLRITTNATYFAASDKLPAAIRPKSPMRINPATDPHLCWSRPWKLSRFR